MRNIILIGSLLLLFVTFSSGQKTSLKICEQFKSGRFERLGSHIHSTNSSHFFYKYTKKSFGYEPTPLKNVIIEKYDDDMKLVFSKKIPAFQNKTTHLDIKYINGAIVWFYYVDKKRTRTLYAAKINQKGIVAKPKRLGQLKYYKNHVNLPYKNVKYITRLSQDSSKFVIFSLVDRNLKRKGIDASFCVINENIEILWSRNTMAGIKQVNVDILDWELSNDGSVYYASKIFNNNQLKESKNSKPDYKCSINHLRVNDTKLVRFDINLKSKFIRDLYLGSDDLGNLYYSGLYANSKSKVIHGFFSGKLNSKDKNIQFSQYEFTNKDINKVGKNSTDKGKKDKKKGLKSGFEVDKIILKPNGNVINLIEEYRHFTRTNGQTYSHCYLILIIEQNKNGEVVKIDIIPKKQLFNSYSIMSFTTIISGNNIHYFYSDHKTNLSKNITEQDKIKSILTTNSLVLANAVFNKGKLTRTKVLNRDDENYLLLPNFCQQIANNKLFVIMSKSSYSGTKYVLGTLTIED